LPAVFILKANKPEQLNVGLFDCVALPGLRRAVAGLSARRLWIENSEIYLCVCCTKWHWDTCMVLFTVFPYHSFSKNSCYLF